MEETDEQRDARLREAMYQALRDATTKKQHYEGRLGQDYPDSFLKVTYVDPDQY